MGNAYEEMLKMAVSPFISHPEHVQVQVSGHSQARNIAMMVHRTDQSMVIGGQARMVQALKALLRQMAAIRNERIWFEILEPQIGVKEREIPFDPKHNWNSSDDACIGDAMKGILKLIYDLDFEVHVKSSSDRTDIEISSLTSFPIEVLSALGVVFRAIGKGMGRKSVAINVACNQTSESAVDR